MTLLGIDIGTTHCKAGLFDMDGATIRIASQAVGTVRAPEGYTYIDPETLWQTLVHVIKAVSVARPGSIRAVGITSMAESGLLLNPQSGTARTPIIPWFEKSAQPQAERVSATTDPVSFFIRSGLRMSYKCSLAKILWLRDRGVTFTYGDVWLSTADYAAYQLTGAPGTDYSLAGRTGLFDIHHKVWDENWLEQWDLTPDRFPTALPGGKPVGHTAARWTELGIPQDTPVAISGHDHICAAFVASLVSTTPVFDSMGTAEVLIGAYPHRKLTSTDYETGLSIGCHVANGQDYWMGGLSTSGGAIEWIRRVFNDTPLSYADLIALIESAGPEPTGILCFPYLLGSGSPHSDPSTRAAWIGLHHGHTRAELVKAVFEGTAYEMEFIRRAGEAMTGPITLLTAAGGGTRNHAWLQIKANVSGCPVAALSEPDITLLGAAVAAGMGQGFYENAQDGLTAFTRKPEIVMEPDPQHHERYRALFEQGYLELQQPLRRFSTILAQ